MDITETTTTTEARRHIWILLLQDAQSHLLAVASTVAKLGIEQRRAEIDAATAATLKAVIVMTLHRLAGIAADDPRITVEVPAIIRELTGGDDDD